MTVSEGGGSGVRSAHAKRSWHPSSIPLASPTIEDPGLMVECSSDGGVVSLKGRVWSSDGEAEFCAEESGGLGDAAKIGERVAAAVKAQAGASAPSNCEPAILHLPDSRCAGRCLGARRRGVGCRADPLGQGQLNVIRRTNLFASLAA